MAAQNENFAAEAQADDTIVSLPLSIDGAHDEIPAYECPATRSNCSRNPCVLTL
jgi:hypothetical protein